MGGLRTTLWSMKRQDDPTDDERRRRLAALDTAAAERDRLFNAALIEADKHGLYPRLELSQEHPRR